MLAVGDEVLLVHVGRKDPNVFKHWHWYNPADRWKEKNEYLNQLRYKGSGYGFAYYYNGDKIWFRSEKHLTMWLLKFHVE